MFTACQRYFTNIICIIGIFWSSCLQANHEYHSQYEWLDYYDLDEGEDPPRNYDVYGEFGDMLREFDRKVDDYDRSIDCK